MADSFDILESVKNSLGITGEFMDQTLKNYIDEVKAFMTDAGVSRDVADSNVSAGVITRGVADLWNYGSGGTSLSPYFMQRVGQLAFSTSGGDSNE